MEALKKLASRNSIRRELLSVHYSKSFTEATDSFVFGRINISFLVNEKDENKESLYLNVQEGTIQKNVNYPSLDELIKQFDDSECVKKEFVFAENYEDLYADLQKNGIKVEPKFLKKVCNFISTLANDSKSPVSRVFATEYILLFEVGNKIGYAGVALRRE